MTISNISNARYIEASETLIDMEIEVDGAVLPFTYNPADAAAATAAVAVLLAQGGVVIAPYQPPA